MDWRPGPGANSCLRADVSWDWLQPAATLRGSDNGWMEVIFSRSPNVVIIKCVCVCTLSYQNSYIRAKQWSAQTNTQLSQCKSGRRREAQSRQRHHLHRSASVLWLSVIRKEKGWVTVCSHRRPGADTHTQTCFSDQIICRRRGSSEPGDIHPHKTYNLSVW